MKGDRRHIWIEAGYSRFSQHGEAGLTVEAIARDLGKNKSSFYHYFGELKVLKAEVLKKHIENSKKVGEKIGLATKMDPDILNIIIDHKEDFLFHKQLKLHSSDTFEDHYKRAYALVETPLVKKLSEALGLGEKQLFSKALLDLVSDNFLLRIQEETLSIEWLRNYLQELRILTSHMK